MEEGLQIAESVISIKCTCYIVLERQLRICIIYVILFYGCKGARVEEIHLCVVCYIFKL